MPGFGATIAEPKIFFKGYLSGDTAVGTMNTWETLKWLKRYKRGVTHTDGSETIYILTSGYYIIDLLVVTTCINAGHRILTRVRYTDPDSVAANIPQARGADAGNTPAAVTSCVLPATMVWLEAGSNIHFEGNHPEGLDVGGVHYKALYTHCNVWLYERGG